MNPGLRTHHSASLSVAVAKGLPVDMWEKTREIIDVNATARRRGHATALMWTVCAEADLAWLTLIVQPLVFDDGMAQDKLEKWYKKFGFDEIQKTPVVLMARSPQKPVIAITA